MDEHPNQITTIQLKFNKICVQIQSNPNFTFIHPFNPSTRVRHIPHASSCSAALAGRCYSGHPRGPAPAAPPGIPATHLASRATSFHGLLLPGARVEAAAWSPRRRRAIAASLVFLPASCWCWDRRQRHDATALLPAPAVGSRQHRLPLRCSSSFS
ncbi:hypothetical protein BS78_10G081200 [Paspalum vaginatum]|nr:hypothetical protein BS78_10G081200 [Paspalum vaginatum]